jgi:integral membrane sensor domain MASE1
MNSSPLTRQADLPSTLAALALLLALAITRSGHFGSVVSLPDATTAVFFLLGLCVVSPRWILIGLGLAAVVDAIVIAGGVSAVCATPAYVFLIPTYGAMWLAGRWARNRSVASNLSARLRLTAAGVGLGTGVAFLLSNGSFYLLSGRFADLSMAAYSAGVVRYFPPYFAYTSLYVGLGLVVITAIRALAAHATRGQTIPLRHG